jgi:hypothetical protein
VSALKLEQDGRALHDDSVRLVAPHEFLLSPELRPPRWAWSSAGAYSTVCKELPDTEPPWRRCATLTEAVEVL